MSTTLYQDEQLVTGCGYPVVVRFMAGEPGRPLVIFMPDVAHLARIAYGYPGGRAEDYLAFWLQRAGFSFLGASYPLEHVAFPDCCPDFTLRAWGLQTMEIADQFMKAHQLGRRAIVLAWGAAGRTAEPVAAAARNLKIELELFVAVSASSPLSGAASTPADIHARRTERGLLDLSGSLYPWSLRSLRDQNQLNGHLIVPEEIYLREFVGNCPVNVAASFQRYRKGQFVRDPREALEDAAAFHYSGFPLCGVLYGSSARDALNALLEPVAWGAYMVQALYQHCVVPNAIDLGLLPSEAFRLLIEILHSAPKKLSEAVEGNHFFFVGARGAMETVAALDRLRSRLRAVTREILRLLESDVLPQRENLETKVK